MNNKVENNQIHFETQGSLSNECGVHALNNILGKEAFTCQRLNSICASLSTDLINPHKHIFGGDFDANILIIALQQEGYECCWIDNRKKQEIITKQNIRFKKILGFLVNKQSKVTSPMATFFKNVLGFSGRHWIVVKNINQSYYLLDSKRERIEQISDIAKFLAIQIEMGSHIIEVFDKNQVQNEEQKKKD